MKSAFSSTVLKYLALSALAFGSMHAFADVALVGTPKAVVGGGTVAADAGSNRVVVIALGRRNSGTSTATPTVTALTWGSLSLNAGITLASRQSSTGNGRCSTNIWYVKEADIPAGAQTLSASWSVSPMAGSGDLFTVYTLSGVNQTTPIDTTVNVNNGNGADPWTMSGAVAGGSAQITSGCVFAQAAFSNLSPPFNTYRDTNDTSYRVFSDGAFATPAGALTWSRDFTAGSQQGATTLTSFASATEGVKWHPGHYLTYTSNQGRMGPDEISDIDDWIHGLVLGGPPNLCSNAHPNVKGLRVTVRWAVLEGATAGAYQAGFDAIDALLDTLAACNNLRLMLSISERTFGYVIPPEQMPLFYPEYLLSDPLYGTNDGVSQFGGVRKRASGETWTGGLEVTARLWNSNVMARLNALAQAYGAHFNDSNTEHHANLEMMSIGETAFGVPSTTGFNATNWYTNYKSWYSALASAGPRIVSRMNLNFTNGDSAMRDLIAHCASLGNCTVGGPDPELPLPLPPPESMDDKRYIQANQIYRGLSCGGCTITDWRGDLAWVGEVQALGYSTGNPGPAPGPQTAEELYTYFFGTMNMSYMIWTTQSNLTQSMTLIDRTDRPMAMTTCPDNFPSCSTTP